MVMCDLIGYIRCDDSDVNVILKRHGNVSELAPQ